MVRFSPKTRDGQVGDGIAISKNGKSQQTKQKNDGELIAEFQKKCTEDNSLRYEEREVATLRKQYLPLIQGMTCRVFSGERERIPRVGSNWKFVGLFRFRNNRIRVGDSTV
ncbi:hypothetical protein ACLOJK_010028 [Asimina triloba]